MSDTVLIESAESLSEADRLELVALSGAGIHSFAPAEPALPSALPSRDPTWQERLACENLMADTDNANRDLERAVVKPGAGGLSPLGGAVPHASTVSAVVPDTASDDTHRAAQEVTRLKSHMAELEATKGVSRGSARLQVEDDLEGTGDDLKRANYALAQARLADTERESAQSFRDFQAAQAAKAQAEENFNRVEMRHFQVVEELRQIKVDVRAAHIALPF